MKRFLALAIVPFLLTVPVQAGTMEKDVTAEVEGALSGGSQENGDILSEVEGALSGGSQDNGDILSEVEDAMNDEARKEIAEEPETTEEAEGEVDTAFTPQQVRYHFEHSILPRYFYELPENMLDVLDDPGIYMLWDSITNENGVDPTYSEEEYITHWYVADDGTLIVQVEMPEPEETPLCYRVYFVYNMDSEFAGYYTAEYDYLFEESNLICTWDEEMNHSILADGAVLKKDSDDFKEGLMEEAKQVAELAGISTELISVDDEYDPDAIDTAEPADDTEPTDEPDIADVSEPTDETEPADDTEPTDEPDITDVSESTDEPDITDVLEPTDEPDIEGDFDTSGLAEVSCPELGFSFMADPAYEWDYEEGTGITVYTENEGSIPYVIVYQGEDLIGEPFDYIQEQFTPYMKEKYGDDLQSADEYEELEVGGKTLPGGVYSYDVQGHLVIMVRMYDSTGDRTVAYTAKFLDEDGEDTLNALDAAVRTFQAE